MYHLHEVSRAVHVDREREIRDRLPRVVGLPSGSRHPHLPDSGIVVPGPRRFELRHEPRPAVGG